MLSETGRCFRYIIIHMEFKCPACQSPVYNRRSKACGQCGASLPPEFLLSDEQVLKMYTKQEREHKQANASATLFEAHVYSPEQELTLREAFRPVANRYRLHNLVAEYVWLVWLLVTVVTFVVLPGMVSTKGKIKLAGTTALACVVISVGAKHFAPKLKCPGCLNDLMKGSIIYCPSCGGNRVEPISWWFGLPQCADCSKKIGILGMGMRKIRLYKIRACRHCGLQLDERGI